MTLYSNSSRGKGECQRSGLTVKRRRLTRDGYAKGLKVLKGWYEPSDRAGKRPVPIDAQIIRDPAPEISHCPEVVTFPVFDVENASYPNALIMSGQIGAITVVVA